MSILTLRLMPWNLSVVKLPSGESYDWIRQGTFYSLTQTLDELSLVCESGLVPAHLAQEHGWRVFKIEAILDFNLVGIMAKIANAFASAHVSIFTLSTFNTDYILVKQDQVGRAIASLQQHGYKVLADD